MLQHPELLEVGKHSPSESLVAMHSRLAGHASAELTTHDRVQNWPSLVSWHMPLMQYSL